MTTLKWSVLLLIILALSYLVYLQNSPFTNNASKLDYSNAQFDKMSDDMAAKFKAPLITQAEFKKRMSDEKVYILDARESAEYNVSHIPGALHVGYENFDLKSSVAKLDKSIPMYVYCSVGYRSGDIAAKLQKAGYNAYNLHGGIFAWTNNQEKVVNRHGNPTDKIHGYNTSWGKWLKQGKIVYN